MKLILKLREVYQRCEPWFKASEEVLEILHESRGNGLLTKALGTFSITGTLLKAALPKDSMEAFLQRRRFRNGSYQNIGGFICELLLDRVRPTATLTVGLTTQLFLWEYEKGSIAAVFHGDEYGDGPLLRDGDDEFLASILRNLLWKDQSDLMLSAQANGYFWRCYKKYRLVPMPEPDPYIGHPGPKELAHRLDQYGGIPRTILLRGPTGIGKSVLARHTARLVRRGSHHTLKIAGSVLHACRFDELISLVRLLQPSVLLLDDLSLDDRQRVEEFLLMLESLRDPNCLVFVTMMTSEEPKKKPQLGDAYFPGMRPGRIDEVHSLRLPNERQRDAILSYYYDKFGAPKPSRADQQKIVRATKSLSGAYLAEVARRIKIHGIKSWRTETEQVTAAAPRLEKKGEGPKGKAEGPSLEVSESKCHPSPR